MRQGRPRRPAPRPHRSGFRDGPGAFKGEVMRILVVDDSEDARDIMAVTLSSGGYEDLTFATSGQEGLDRLAQGGSGSDDAFDLVLLDVMMPGMDGIEVCARIRADARHQDLPILMVSSLSDSDSLSQAFIAGANDYVTKPIHRLELLARVRSIARLRGERDLRQAREAELLETGRKPEAGSRAGTPTLVDPLTGLLGWETFEALVQRAPAADVPRFGALAWQIDDLDRVRVRDGEQAARDLIKSTARVLQALPARIGDHLAHYDDGIFVAFARNCSEAELAELAARARSGVAGTGTTLSVGTVISDGRERTPRDVVADAIAAAERAAEDGGDRVVTRTALLVP